MTAIDHGPSARRTIDEMVELVRHEYGLTVDLRPVGGEVAWNYIATTDSGGRLFLKCAEAGPGGVADVVEADLLARMLEADPETPVARPISTRSGANSLPWNDRTVWLTTFRTGTSVDPDRASPRLRQDIGRALAMVDRSLRDVVVAQAPTTRWDLQRADELIGELDGNSNVTDAERLVTVLKEFTSEALPALRALRQQVIHNDANGDNVLAGNGLVTVIDFGDAVIGTTVQEVGTALAYLTSSESVDQLVESMADVVAGYHMILPMPAGWPELLPRVARARCALALANTRIHAAALPSGLHRDYVLRNERRTARRLQLLLSLSVEAQATALRRALWDRGVAAD